MAVDTVLQVVADRLPDYAKIRDCVAGQRAVKTKKLAYLPNPDPLDVSAAGKLRYDTYLQRATFYPVTGRTLRGLVGLVFDKDPAIEHPPLLAPVIADAGGDGVSLDQRAAQALRENVSLGRGGILTDYPVVSGPTTVQAARSGNIRPTMTYYQAEQIINWRHTVIGAKKFVSLVVLREDFVKEDDGFALTTATRFRVLRLTDGIYTVELHTPGDSVDVTRFTPTDGKGRPLTEIPFEFIGAEKNDAEVDEPPLLDMAELNVQHFMNSADYEESVFMVGQPTPVFSGLTKDWVESVFREEVDDGHGKTKIINKVRLGSRGGISLPVGGTADLLQAQPNTMAFEAMEHKEAQMLALGAKLLENTGTQQTATEATLDSVLDNSVLATAARNVSAAFTRSLRWCWLFMTGEWNEDENFIDYKLNDDFGGKLMTAQDRQAIVTMWTQRAITYTEMRWGLRRAGSAYLTDKEAKAESDAERETNIDFEATAAAALADATGDAAPPTKGKGKPGDKAK